MKSGNNFWQDKKIFITGHTGFKGSWLCLWLNKLGAQITGYSLPPPTNPNLFELAKINDLVHTIVGDVRDHEKIVLALRESEAEIVIHMAAQPLVRDSYKNPVETYATNVMGTVNLLDAVRFCPGIRSVVNITTDKCYENNEWVWGYRENEPLGGYDPYSNSKGCSELATSAFRNSFFNPDTYSQHGVAMASARAGNVIGGGDWAADRLVPDCMKSILKGEKIIVRNPHATRPWQHVLEPLNGYLRLAQALYKEGPKFASGWNFGPDDNGCCPVENIVRMLCQKWGTSAEFEIVKTTGPHEANFLKLDCSKAKANLGWKPVWDLTTTMDAICDWYKNYQDGRDIKSACADQIDKFISSDNF